MTVSLSVDGKVTEVPDGATIEVFGARRVSVLFVMELGEETGPVDQVRPWVPPKFPRAASRSDEAREVAAVAARQNRKRKIIPLPDMTSDPPPRLAFDSHKSQRTYDELLPVAWHVMADRQWRSFSALSADVQQYLAWDSDLVRARLAWLVRRLRVEGHIEVEPLRESTGPKSGPYVYLKYRRPE